MPVKTETKTENQEKELYEKVVQYQALDTEIKRLTKELAPIKEELKAALPSVGVEQESGHITKELTGSKGTFIIQNQLRISTGISVHAIDVIKEFDPKNKSGYIETTEIVREDILKDALEKGLITDEQAEQLFTLSKTYAFTLKKKLE